MLRRDDVCVKAWRRSGGTASPVAISQARGHGAHIREGAHPGRHGGTFYQTLAAYDHFGRSDLDTPWEREDLVTPLGRAAGRTG